VVSWPEGAFRLETGAGSSEEGKEGWEGLGREERELLNRVGEVSDAAGVCCLLVLIPPTAELTDSPSPAGLHSRHLPRPRLQLDT
jgi:hypothetical protein